MRSAEIEAVGLKKKKKEEKKMTTGPAVSSSSGGRRQKPATGYTGEVGAGAFFLSTASTVG